MQRPRGRIVWWLTMFVIVAIACLGFGGSALDLLLATIVTGVVFETLLGILHALGISERRSAIPRLMFFCILACVGVKCVWVLAFLPAPTARIAEQRAELLARRDYLVHRVLERPFGPQDSPQFLPDAFKEEWAIGTLSMLGAALANLSYSFPDTRAQHQAWAEQMIRRMLKPDIRFYENRYWKEDALVSLAGENGHIGYLGHLNLLIGINRLLGGTLEFDSLHEQISAALARRIDARPTKFLETFPGQIFIPDNAVVVASLSLYDTVHAGRAVDGGRQQVGFAGTINSWLEYTKVHLLDPQSGIILPHVDVHGAPQGLPRGSYATWNVFYLLQIDRDFAVDQAARIRQHFLAAVGPRMCGIREALPGNPSVCDIDSGPVLFGVSTSGTGFGLASARILDDEQQLGCLLTTGEVVGTTIATQTGQRYLAAPLIGDAIVLAMRTATKWDDRFIR